MDQEFFKLIANNLVSCVIAYMLLKFFIEIMRKKLLNSSESEKSISTSIQNLNKKFDNSEKRMEDCLGKVAVVLDGIVQSQAKTAALLESIDRRINGRGKN
jgi:hypothetical protein